MHFIVFKNNKNYQSIKDFIDKNNAANTYSNAKELFAIEKARSAVENNTQYCPEKKYDINKLVDRITNKIIKCNKYIYECINNFGLNRVRKSA